MVVATLLVFLFANYFVFLEADFTLYANTSHVDVVRCIEKERQALLKFKDGVVDPSGFLSSWVGYDCCTWKGVGCRHPTGQVVKLHLSNPKCYSECIASPTEKCSFCLQGELSKYIGDLQYLSYLNVSYNKFSGMIPRQIANLSNLHVLDLNMVGDYVYVSDLNWISGLSSLKYLGLSKINLSLATNHWLQAINTIPSLVELHLFFTGLQTIPNISPGHLNLSSLSVLDLGDNLFATPTPPQWLFNLSTNLAVLKLSACFFTSPFSSFFGGISLTYNHSDFKLEELDFSFNLFSGDLQDSLVNLKSLRTLDLSCNNITGPLPTSIGNLSKLKILNLAYNKMNGLIPKSLGRLKELKVLDLLDNEWEGILSQDLFQSLAKLKELSISSRSGGFHLNLTRNWVPPFNLTSIHIKDQDIGPKFPTWLRFSQLESITLQNASISDISSWFWKLFPLINELDLSHNQIRGTIPVDIAQIMPFLEDVDLSWNFLNGSIPSSIGKLDNLYFLYLSNNQLFGKIHDQLPKSMTEIDLSNNELSGKLPISLCSSPYLRSLKLRNNRLSGKLSLLLKTCRSLELLDLRGNKFTGSIPKWIGESQTRLKYLSLRNNLLNGSISDQLCHINKNLHVLDLAQNNFSGCIPACLSELNGMKSVEDRILLSSMVLNLKGTEYMYNPSTLRIVKYIDLSCNSLSGVIPEEIMNLVGLGTLNLSNNHLTGKIPSSIGEMQNLETLDLSSNHFYGQIPPSISSLHFLNHLNLSHNNLSGPIPSGTQLLSFNDIYEGNLGLCGSPLPKKCVSPFVQEEGRNDPVDEKEDGKLELFVSIALGFIFGFWSICGSLVLNKSWRDAYYGPINKIVDWIVLIVAVILNWLRKKITRDVN